MPESCSQVSETPFWSELPVVSEVRDKLPDRAGIVVVGGGLTGLSAALELVKHGRSVTIVEAGRIGHGASGRSMGLISGVARESRLQNPKQVLRGHSQQQWHLNRIAAERLVNNLIAEAGIECKLQHGAVLLAATRRNLGDLAKTLDVKNRFYGTTDYLVSAQQLQAEAGGDVPQMFAGGRVMPEAQRVHPGLLMQGLAAYARSRGVIVCENTAVVSIQKQQPGFVVETGAGRIIATEVLVATGGYTGRLSDWLWRRSLGVPATTAVSDEMPREVVASMFPSNRMLLINKYRGFSCRPTPDGTRIVLAGPAGGPVCDATCIRRYFLRLFPDLADVRMTHCWHGLIGVATDGNCHAGRWGGVWYSLCATSLVNAAFMGHKVARKMVGAGDAQTLYDEAPFEPWLMRSRESFLVRAISVLAWSMDAAGISRQR